MVRGDPPEPDLKRITSRHSRMVETDQRVGFNLSVPYACYIPNVELRKPANERPPVGRIRVNAERERESIKRER